MNAATPQDALLACAPAPPMGSGMVGWEASAHPCMGSATAGQTMRRDSQYQRLMRRYGVGQKTRLLVVENEPMAIMEIKAALEDAYTLHYAGTHKQALSMITTIQADLVLIDADLPDNGGFTLHAYLKKNLAQIPVAMLVPEGQESKAFAAGASDLIRKPLMQKEVRSHIDNLRAISQLREIKESRLKIIRKLSRAAEFRDNETGAHFERMSGYSRVLATAMGLPSGAIEDITTAAPMHDIGKIGIPDNILLKQGRLTPAEYLVMQQHPAIGASILHDADDASGSDSIIAMAYQIALTHHEKWDGTGYPNGLVAEQIPLEGRIVALADVFDALTSVRPYKRAWAFDDAVAHIDGLFGIHFDPALKTPFMDSLTEFRRIQLISD